MGDTGKFAEGEMIIFETGAYSDQFIVGCFRALRDIPFSEWNEIRARHIRNSAYIGNEVDANAMIAEMIRRKMIEEATGVWEVHAEDVMSVPPDRSRAACPSDGA